MAAAVSGAIASIPGNLITTTAVGALGNIASEGIRGNIKNKQRNVNQNLINFGIKSAEQVEKRFWVYKAGIYSGITSTGVGMIIPL